jgi:hypothetical protein
MTESRVDRTLPAIGKVFLVVCLDREISPRSGRQTLAPGVSLGLITTEGAKPASAGERITTPYSIPFTPSRKE